MCTERYINPFTDFGFKKLFGTAANKEFLISFLNSLFESEDPITDISYRNVEQLGMRPDGRVAVFDIYCTTERGEHIIVEMQNAYQRYFMDRSIYYSSYPMHEVMKKGDWNFRLPKIYTVAFLNFCMSEYVDDPGCKHTVMLTDTATGKVFYDKLMYVYLEMPKFEKELEELDGVFDTWMYIIKNINQLDDVPKRLQERLYRRFFREAEIQAFSSDERTAYEISLKAMRDYNNTIESAEWKGEQKGRAEGRAEGIMQVAKTLKELGRPVEEIERATGLSIAEIENL